MISALARFHASPAPLRRGWALIVLCTIWAALLVQPAFAQERRAILWLVDTNADAGVDRATAARLFQELLQTATDADHIVDVEGLADHLQANGYPLPDCLTGGDPCPDLAQALARELRIDIVAHVQVGAGGRTMTLTVRGVAGDQSRTLEFAGDTMRETALRAVSDFVGASSSLAVASRPTGATVILDGELQGTTPFQAEVPAGIYTLRVELDGYETHEQALELRPNQARLVDLDLVRQFVTLNVRTSTPGAMVVVDHQPAVPANQPIRLEPGAHAVRIEAPGYTSEDRQLDLAAGSDQDLQIDLRESPETIRARRMGYIYERPFFFRGAFRFAGTRAGLSEATGSLGGAEYTIRCPRTVQGTCSAGGVPINWVGLDIGLGYSFKHFEIVLISFAYATSQVGGSAGDGRTFTLTSAERDELGGNVSSIHRIEVRPLAPGFRVLFTDSWSVFAHGGIGWYREFFEVGDTPLGPQTGDFARTGWAWAADVGARYHLNDTVYLEAAFGLGDDLSHDDSDLATAVSLGLAVTWEDVFGIDDLVAGDDEPEGEGAPPAELEGSSAPEDAEEEP